MYHKDYCDNFLSLALILNGYPYKFAVKREPKLEINAHYNEDMFSDSLHEKKCDCQYPTTEGNDVNWRTEGDNIIVVS